MAACTLGDCSGTLASVGDGAVRVADSVPLRAVALSAEEMEAEELAEVMAVVKEAETQVVRDAELDGKEEQVDIMVEEAPRERSTPHGTTALAAREATHFLLYQNDQVRPNRRPIGHVDSQRRLKLTRVERMSVQ